MRRIAAALVVLALAASPCLAEKVDSFTPLFGRNYAAGGLHAALADDFTALFSNPASLVEAEREVYASRLGLRASGPIFDIASALLSGGEMVDAFMNILSSNGYKLYAGADLYGPIAFGYVGGGLGFGLFNSTHVSLNAASATSIGLSAGEDLLLMGGYAFGFDLGGGHRLDFGLTAKGFARGEISESLDALTLFGMLDDPMALLDLPFKLTTGVGVDAGIRWNWDGIFAAGLACRDAYSPALVTTYDNATAFATDPSSAHPSSESVTLEPDLAFGLSWRPRMGSFERYLDSVLVSLDYRDLLDLAAVLPRNPALNVGLGLEVQLLDILQLRAGVSDALLNAGVGIDLSALRVDVAVFGTELGLDPGDRPTYNMVASFEFSY